MTPALGGGLAPRHNCAKLQDPRRGQVITKDSIRGTMTSEYAEKPRELLVVQVNGTPMLEYDRARALSPKQRASLMMLDEKLDAGIFLNGEFITSPSEQERVEFMAGHLVSALLGDEEGIAAASCAYLAKVLPELKQVRASEKDGVVSIELIFDRDYQKELQMKFVPLDKLRSRH